MTGFACSARLALYLTTILILERAALKVECKATQNATTSDSNSSIAVLSKTARERPFQNSQSLHQVQVGSHHQLGNDLSKSSVADKLRIDLIKAKILAKLQMDRPPVLKINPKDSKIKELLANLNLIGAGEEEERKKDQENDYYGRTTQIIAFSEKAKVPPSRSKRNSSRKLLFHFKLEQKALLSTVPSASLWIHMRKSKRHELNEKFVHIESPNIESEGERNDRQDIKVIRARVRKEKKSGSGWVQLDIKDVVKHWFNKTTLHNNATDRVVRTLEISCQDCETDPIHLFSSRGRLRPFLVIDLEKPKAHSRRARFANDNCAASAVTCCRRTLYVNFTKIGWDWIIFPSGFFANYCEGSCKGRIVPINSYAFMLQEVMMTVGKELSICCSPAKSSSLHIIHFDSDENIVKTEVQNMRVEECGCS